MKVLTDLKTYTLAPEEIEAMLAKNFGNKLQPVDSAMLAKHRQQQASLELYKKRFQKS